MRCAALEAGFWGTGVSFLGGGGDGEAGLGGGRKPATAGREAALDLVGIPAAWAAGPDLWGAWRSSPLFSSSRFSGRWSWGRRGRGSLVLPLTVRPVGTCEASSSLLMESCLKEKAAPGPDLGPEDGAAASLFSEGSTFLTTRRITFTTFLRASASGRSAWAGLLSAVPLCSPSLL